jgi:hypothetical protein
VGVDNCDVVPNVNQASSNNGKGGRGDACSTSECMCVCASCAVRCVRLLCASRADAADGTHLPVLHWNALLRHVLLQRAVTVPAAWAATTSLLVS